MRDPRPITRIARYASQEVKGLLAVALDLVLHCLEIILLFI